MVTANARAGSNRNISILARLHLRSSCAYMASGRSRDRDILRSTVVEINPVAADYEQYGLKLNIPKTPQCKMVPFDVSLSSMSKR